MKNKVCVLLSSYNGERFISEQINSILQQEGIEVVLIIRDDGSKDSTIGIINTLSNSYNSIKLIIGENIGYIRSFTSLVEFARCHYPDIEYFAFSDQDDIWHRTKLKTAIDTLASKSKDTPNLYASNSMKINAKGDEIGLFLPKTPNFNRQNVLRMPILQGCAMVFNRKALEMYADNPSGEIIHDRWMFMICFYLGTFIYDHNPQFMYRIHGGNAIGVAKTSTKKEHLCQSIKYWITKQSAKIYHKANLKFLNDYENKLSKEDLQNLITITTYKKFLSSKIRIAFNKNFMIDPNAGLLQYFSHILHVVFNKI